jgi:hypothetical protein
MFFYFATIDSSTFEVEGEEDCEVFEEDQRLANQGKPSFDLMLLSYSYFWCSITLFISCIIFVLILFIQLAILGLRKS